MPTRAAVVHTDLTASDAAGRQLGDRITAQLGSRPDALILFASPRHDFPALLRAVHEACAPGVLVGSSSAAEFTSAMQGQGLACAIALKAPEMRFTAGVGRGLTGDRAAAARDLVSSFSGLTEHAYGYRSALIMADALAGHSDDLVSEINTLTGGVYTLFGGGAGGDEQFQRRYVFHGTEAIPDAAVALEILSNKPIGLGVRHGWKPNSGPLRVTEAHGMHLASLNAIPAAERSASCSPNPKPRPLPRVDAPGGAL